MIIGQTTNTNESLCPCRNTAIEMATADVTTKTKAFNSITPIGTVLYCSTITPKQEI